MHALLRPWTQRSLRCACDARRERFGERDET